MDLEDVFIVFLEGEWNESQSYNFNSLFKYYGIFKKFFLDCFINFNVDSNGFDFVYFWWKGFSIICFGWCFGCFDSINEYKFVLISGFI